MNKNKAIISEKLRKAITPWHETERREIAHALKIAKNDKALAATLLGIGNTTIYKKLRNPKHKGGLGEKKHG
jgi:transcriptional regulator with PAS, ATPase and Fis domain